MAKKIEFANIKKILVIKFRHIGDVLLTIPVFRALRENFPDAHISALVNSGTGDVLTGNPLIDEVIVFDRGIKKMKPFKKYSNELSFLKMIRAKGFDMTIDLTNGDRPALLSFISGARYRLGWGGEKGFTGKKYLYTHLREPDGRRHMALQNLGALENFGISTENLTVDFSVPESDNALVEKMLEGHGIGKTDPIVHIHPTSRWLFKCWKDEFMAEIIRWLLDKGIKVIVTSSPDKKEMDKAKKILSLVSGYTPIRSPSLPEGSIGKVIDLCGKTTIKQLAAISKISCLFFGVDSAPMHIAAAVGTPVIALFGPSGAFNWGPWDNNKKSEAGSQKSEENPYPNRNGVQTFGMHTVIQRDWKCIPCGKDGCNSSKISNCLEDISADEIKTVLEKKLKDIKK